MNNNYKKLLLLSDVHKKVNHWKLVPELDNPEYVSCFLGDLASGCVGIVRNNIRNMKEKVDYWVEGNHDRAVHNVKHREEEFCSHIDELRNSGHIEIALKLKKYCEEAQNLSEKLDPGEISFFKSIPKSLKLNNNGETVVCVHDTYAPKELIREFIDTSLDPARILDEARAEINFDWMECDSGAKYLATGHTHMPFIASKNGEMVEFMRILEFDNWRRHVKGSKKIKVDSKTTKYIIPLDEDKRYIIGDGSLSSIKNCRPDNGTFIKETYESLISYAILDIAGKKAEFVVKKVA